MKKMWIYEEYPPTKPTSRVGLLVKKKIIRKKTKYQTIEIVDTYEYGRVLVIDKIFQTSQADEFIYHEMMTHLPMISHPNPQKVLIIGAGDGGVLREVLKYPIDQAYLVEIDKAVVDISRKYMNFVSRGAFENPKTKVFYEDGAEFIKKFNNYFDVIIIDSSDPYGPSKILFSKEFYNNVFSALSHDGVMIAQSGGVFSQLDTIKSTQKKLKVIFPYVNLHLMPTPLYQEGLFGLSFASKKDLSKIMKRIEYKYKKMGLETKYYSPQIHVSSSVWPNFLIDIMDKI